jgi:hypothetical protein
VTLGLVIAAVLGTVRESFRSLALGCWAVALLGLLAAALLSQGRVDGQLIWAGVPLQLTGIVLLIAALVAANGARTRLVGTSFGWRQLTATIVAALALLTPVTAALSWVVHGADGPLQRDNRSTLPAFARAELEASPGLRALVLATRPDGSLGYELVDSDGERLDTVGIPPDPSQRRALEAVVADLASPRGSDAAEALSTRAVRYVGLRTSKDSERVAAVLDTQVGLVRRASGRLALWQVAAPTSRLVLLSAALAEQATSGARAPSPELLRTEPPTVVRAGWQDARATIRRGQKGRLLVLADARDRGWVAELDGRRLRPRTAWGWGQAFEVPSSGGTLVLRHTQRSRQVSLALEVALVALISVLAAPGARRRRGLEQDAGDDSDADSLTARDHRVPLAAL